MTTQEPMSTAAREAIRIAEEFEPNNMNRQKSLAREIVAAITLCEAELGAEIISKCRSNLA